MVFISILLKNLQNIPVYPYLLHLLQTFLNVQCAINQRPVSWWLRKRTWMSWYSMLIYSDSPNGNFESKFLLKILILIQEEWINILTRTDSFSLHWINMHSLFCIVLANGQMLFTENSESNSKKFQRNYTTKNFTIFISFFVQVDKVLQ